ncbi:MAG: hypothetical protein QG661_3225, partial [Actinomycetota bacterium]|nr:hypothetical protein [Actinomycetota bacterium]
MPEGAFIAYGRDGAQIRVEHGVGVPALDPAGTVNLKVTFTVEGARYPVYGYLAAAGNDSLLAQLHEAADARRPVAFRVEARRRSGVDPQLPLSELDPKTQLRRVLAQVNDTWSAEVAANLTAGSPPLAALLPVGERPGAGDPVTAPTPRRRGEVSRPAAPAPAETPAVAGAALPAPYTIVSRIAELRTAGRLDLAEMAVACATVTTDVPVATLLEALSDRTVRVLVDHTAEFATADPAPPPAAQRAPLPTLAPSDPQSIPVDTLPAGFAFSPDPDIPGGLVVGEDLAELDEHVDTDYDPIDSTDPIELEAARGAHPGRLMSPASLGKLVKLMALAQLDPPVVAAFLRRRFGVPEASLVSEAAIQSLFAE